MVMWKSATMTVKGSKIILTFIFIMACLMGMSSSLSQCIEDYSPCHCKKYVSGDLSITCHQVTMPEIRRVFDRVKIDNRIDSVNITINPADSSIPANILSDKKVHGNILLTCPDMGQALKVDPNSFRYSADSLLIKFSIKNCDLSQFNLTFLTGFNILRGLSISSSKNFHQIFSTLPPLPSLANLYIVDMLGLKDLIHFPTLVRGLFVLVVKGNRAPFEDRDFSRFLNWVLQSSADSLVALYMNGNELKAIPEEIRHFRNLKEIQASDNSFESLKTGSFNLSSNISYLSLANNQISSIEAGAFQGDARLDIVSLVGNNLTRFDESVFRTILQRGKSGSVYVEKNPLNCTDDPCHLAWLVRDPQLLQLVDGYCSNGTLLTDLNPNELTNCNKVQPIYAKLIVKF